MEQQVLEVQLNQSRDNDTMGRCAVFYATVIETDRDGVFVDYLFLGGETKDNESAEHLARDLANDKAIPGTVIPRVFEFGPDQDLRDLIYLAKKHFQRLTQDMYEQEEIQERMRRR